MYWLDSEEQFRIEKWLLLIRRTMWVGLFLDTIFVVFGRENKLVSDIFC